MADEVKLTWGRTPRDTLERWPKNADGTPEQAAFLTAAAETDGQADMLCAMLRSYGIPAVRRYDGEGALGHVVLGTAGCGAQLYVPASLLEDARALLAPVDEDKLNEEAMQ